MSDGKGGGAYSEDALTVVFAVAVLITGSSVMAWLFAKPQVVWVVIETHRAMIDLASIFTSRFDRLAYDLARADPADPGITLDRLYRLAHGVGAFYRWPVVAVLGVLAVLTFRRSMNPYTRLLDLTGLMREQARTFRFAGAFVGRGLAPVQPAPGAPRPADPALHPAEWIARFATARGTFEPLLARAELARQLGPVWTGCAGAAPHVRCLFAAFALHAARRRDEATELLGDMAASLPRDRDDGPGGPDAPLTVPPALAAKADAILQDPDLLLPCARVAAGHAWTHPAMMSVLTHARQRGGVLNPGMFAFLQLVDRRLYLALDSLGFPIPGEAWHRSAAQAPLIEAAGAREHWAAEREAGAALPIPVIGAAADTIRAKARDGSTQQPKEPT